MSVENWLSRLSPKTARGNRYSFKAFMRWLRENGGEFATLSPEQLIEYQANADNSLRYVILDLVQQYVLSLGGRVNSKVRAYSTIRSFFMHNRAELPRDPSFRIRSDVEPVRGTLTIEELRDMILSSRPAYQAVLLSMFQGGMGAAEFEYWNLNGWSALREALRGDPDVIRVDLPGRKAKRNVRSIYTFIGGDAIEAIRDYLPHRIKGHSIFYNQIGKPILKDALKHYWLRHLSKIGLIRPKRDGYSGNRYGKNLHEIRDVFRSLWEKSPAKASVAEFCMGHVVDPLEYNKAFRDERWTRREYLKALPMLQIMSSGRPFGQVNLDEVEVLRSENESLQARIERLESRLEEYGSPQALIDALREAGLVTTLPQKEA